MSLRDFANNSSIGFNCSSITYRRSLGIVEPYARSIQRTPASRASTGLLLLVRLFLRYVLVLAEASFVVLERAFLSSRLTFFGEIDN